MSWKGRVWPNLAICHPPYVRPGIFHAAICAFTLCSTLVPHIPRYPHDFHLCQQFNLIKLSALNGLEEGATVNFESLRDAGTCFCTGYASTCIARSIAYFARFAERRYMRGEHGFHHGLMIEVQLMVCHPSVRPLLCSYLPVRRHM